MDKRIFSDNEKYINPAGSERFEVIYCSDNKRDDGDCVVLVDTFRDDTPQEIFGKTITNRILRRIDNNAFMYHNEFKLIAIDMNWHANLNHYLQYC